MLSIIQDKGLQKQYYSDNKVSTLDFTLATAEYLAEKVAAWSDNKFTQTPKRWV